MRGPIELGMAEDIVVAMSKSTESNISMHVNIDFFLVFAKSSCVIHSVFLSLPKCHLGSRFRRYNSQFDSLVPQRTCKLEITHLKSFLLKSIHGQPWGCTHAQFRRASGAGRGAQLAFERTVVQGGCLNMK